MAARRKHRWWLGIPVVLAGVLALAWWLPAGWVWWAVRGNLPAVSVRDIHGSIWSGTANGLVVQGESLGRLDWTLDRLSMLGKPRGTFSLGGNDVTVHGHIARPGTGVVVFNDVDFRIPATRFQVSLPAGFVPGGMIVGKVNVLRLVDGWPDVLDAHVDWDSARLLGHGDALALGNFRSRWQSRAGGVINGGLTNVGEGPVALDGGVVLSPLGWRLDATLRQRRADPRLSRLLDRLGTRDATGAVHVRRRGGLAMLENVP